MAYQQMFNKIFHAADKEENVSAFLQKITQQYRYFGLAQFYSLKYSIPENSAFNITAAKSALFFTSNYYLQSRLKEIHSSEKQIIHAEKIEQIQKEKYVIEEEKIIVEKEELLFEPLHASDYFASQGIKLSEEALGSDKLGKQLKSFTSWLKTMKKVHPDKLPLVNSIIESAVQTQAEQSNVEEEIVTEPMAEAYILQNKVTKAVEIYNKLSLLNPAKSAYFAAKIDSLKK